MSDTKLRDRANEYALAVLETLELPVHSTAHRNGIVTAIARAFVTGYGAGMESSAELHVAAALSGVVRSVS